MHANFATLQAHAHAPKRALCADSGYQPGPRHADDQPTSIHIAEIPS